MSKEYDVGITARKGVAGATQYGSVGVLLGVALIMLRENCPNVKLWPVEMDAAVIGALTGMMAGALRAALNWRKHS